MALDRFLIAPFVSGQQTNVRPFLIPEDSFESIENLYVFRGRVRKRFGGRLSGYGWAVPEQAPYYSRVRVALSGGAGVGITNGAGNAAGFVPGAIFNPGAAFIIGNATYTVTLTGAVQPMLQTDATVTATFSTTNGAYNFAGAPAATQIYFFPGEPIMGLTIYEQANTTINNQPSWAFDTQFAYLFAGGTWTGQPTPVWRDPSGNKANFFWTNNWHGITDNIKLMFVTNYQVAFPNGAGQATDDPMWYYNGTAWTSISGANGFYFLPNGGAVQTGRFVQTARIIMQYKDRLVLLNTIENDNSGGLGNNLLYSNRCRYSINGSPLAQNAWYEPNQMDSSGIPAGLAAGAGFIDASTDEAIVSAEFIKDRLIVFFERSTWELAYTGNQVLPFVWQKLNTELGSQSLLSSIPFDKQILTVGNVGVFGCNGSNVARIDQKVPDFIFEVRTANQGVYRVGGIRNFYTEMAYWTFPSQEIPDSIFPDTLLTYNYANDSWSEFDDCITAFGYLEQQQALTWATWLWTWDQSIQPWNSGMLQAGTRVSIAGNQQGYIFIIDDDFPRNAPVMQISNITITSAATITLQIMNHTLRVGADYIVIENALGVNMNLLNGGSYQIETAPTPHTVTISNPGVPLAGAGTTYIGGGSATRVSNLKFLSKQWNPYLPNAQNVFLQKIEFGVEKTTSGSITIDYYPSSTTLSMITGGQATNSILGTSILDTFAYTTANTPGALNDIENAQVRIVHPVYFQTVGSCIQLSAYLNNDQMTNPFIVPQPVAGPTRVPLKAWENFEIDYMVLFTSPSGRLS